MDAFSRQQDITRVMESLQTWMQRVSSEEPNLSVDGFVGRIYEALDHTFAGSRHGALSARVEVVQAAAQCLGLDEYSGRQIKDYLRTSVQNVSPLTTPAADSYPLG